MEKKIIEAIANVLADKTIFCTKEVLTSDEVARYMGISKSYLYKLTMNRQIPHYKPMGKVCFFNRKEIEDWLQSAKIPVEKKTNTEYRVTKEDLLSFSQH